MYVYITRMLLFTYMQINIWDSPLSWGLLYAIHFGLPTIYSYNNNSDCNVNYVHFRQCVRLNEAAIYATCHLPLATLPLATLPLYYYNTKQKCCSLLFYLVNAVCCGCRCHCCKLLIFMVIIFSVRCRNSSVNDNDNFYVLERLK